MQFEIPGNRSLGSAAPCQFSLEGRPDRCHRCARPYPRLTRPTMVDASTIASHAAPRLAGFVRLQHDQTRGRWVLQAPERVLVLDETGKAILDRCDGEATVEAIITELANEYDAPRDVIEHDVRTVLALLAQKSFLVLADTDEPR